MLLASPPGLLVEHDPFLKRCILGEKIRPERDKGQQKHCRSQENGLAGRHCMGMYLAGSDPGRSDGGHRAVADKQQAKPHFTEARKIEKVAHLSRPVILYRLLSIR